MKSKKHKKAIGLETCKRVVGIDVCKNSVSVVRLEKSNDRISLIGCSRVKIENGSSSGNESENFKAIANAVKKSGITGYPRHSNAGLCLCTTPELLQLVNLPDSSPDATRKFIQEEIRQYAVLPLKNVQIDYCVLRTAGTSEQKSVLVGAAQSEPLKLATKELEKNHVDVQSIEPPVVSLIRACYSKVIKPGGNKNIMFVLLHDENMSLCVFSGQKFDFLRTKKFDFDISSTTEHTGAIAEQIDSVVQFYELEKTSDQKNWPVFLAGSCELSTVKEIVQNLKNHITRQNIEISAIDISHVDIISEGTATDDFSPVAAGAAMKLLNVNDSGTGINLLPNDIYEIRKARSQLLVIINIAAVIFLLIFIYIAFLTKKTASARNELRQDRQNLLNINMPRLIHIRADVNDRTQQMTRNIDITKTALKDKVWNNWAFILADVCTKAPPTIQIENLESHNSSTLKIDGIAVNYAAINTFIDHLTKCKMISSAQLADARQNTQYGNGLLNFSIICPIASQKIKDN